MRPRNNTDYSYQSSRRDNESEYGNSSQFSRNLPANHGNQTKPFDERTLSSARSSSSLSSLSNTSSQIPDFTPVLPSQVPDFEPLPPANIPSFAPLPLAGVPDLEPLPPSSKIQSKLPPSTFNDEEDGSDDGFHRRLSTSSGSPNFSSSRSNSTPRPFSTNSNPDDLLDPDFVDTRRRSSNNNNCRRKGSTRSQYDENFDRSASMKCHSKDESFRRRSSGKSQEDSSRQDSNASIRNRSSTNANNNKFQNNNNEPLYANKEEENDLRKRSATHITNTSKLKSSSSLHESLYANDNGLAYASSKEEESDIRKRSATSSKLKNKQEPMYANESNSNIRKRSWTNSSKLKSKNNNEPMYANDEESDEVFRQVSPLPSITPLLPQIVKCDDGPDLSNHLPSILPLAPITAKIEVIKEHIVQR
eukprot:Awhi_evm2s13891